MVELAKIEAAQWLGRLARSASDTPQRTAAILAILGGLCLSLAVNLPGHMSYDSVLQLAQGRAGVYNAWHPLVMAWLLGVCDAVVRGTGLFVVFDALLLYGALLVLVLIKPARSWAIPALALAFDLTPDWLIYPGIVWKDGLFAASALASFAVLAAAEARWEDQRLRLGLIVAAFVLLVLAALSRQNGAIVLPFGVVALAWIAGRAGSRPSLKAALTYGLASLAGAGLLLAAASTALDARGDGEPSGRYQFEDLQTYDLTAAVKLRPGLRLEIFDADYPELSGLIRTVGVRAYTPERIDPISDNPALQRALSETPFAAVSAQWLELITRHPDLYLQVRSTAFRWVLATPDIDSCVAVFVGVEGPDAWMARLHMTNYERPQDEALKAYGDALSHTPLFWHGLYGLGAIVLLVLLLRRRAAGDIAVAGMLAAALAFTATFFVVSIACDYRYLYFLDMAAMAAGLYLAAGARPGAFSRMAHRWRPTAR